MSRRGVVLGPKQLADGVVTLRAPRLRDAGAWSAARLANREWLERAFPAWGDDWAAEQQPAAWVTRWWQLRRAAARGQAKPLVILRDGELIGEIGVDAVDRISGGGEASVWMVRAHGSADVMAVASLYLIHYAFTDAPAVDRVISPVATTSRKGRSPGLTAAGLAIEATTPRRVGAAGLVDHDIWTVQNTAENVARVAGLLDRFPAGPAPAEPRARVPLAAAARAALRGALDLARARLRPPAAPALPAPGSGLDLHAVRAGRGPARWQVRRADAEIGVLEIAADRGTGCAEITVSVRDEADRAALGALLGSALTAVRDGAFGPMHAAVRVPAEPGMSVMPDAHQLAGAGLTLVATFAGNPEGPHRWAGEQRWEPAREEPG